MSSTVKTQSPNQRTTREFPRIEFNVKSKPNPSMIWPCLAISLPSYSLCSSPVNTKCVLSSGPLHMLFSAWNKTHVSCVCYIGRQILYQWSTWEAHGRQHEFTIPFFPGIPGIAFKILPNVTLKETTVNWLESPYQMNLTGILIIVVPVTLHSWYCALDSTRL